MTRPPPKPHHPDPAGTYKWIFVMVMALVVGLGGGWLLSRRAFAPDRSQQAESQTPVASDESNTQLAIHPPAPPVRLDRGARDVSAIPNVERITGPEPSESAELDSSRPANGLGVLKETPIDPGPVAVPVVLASTGPQASEIKGTIKFLGTPPENPEIPLDPSCRTVHPGRMTAQFYRVDDRGHVADTFVFIKAGVKLGLHRVSGVPVVLEQVNCQFSPYILGLQTGQVLLVRNSDPLLHNINVTPDPGSGNYPSNVAQPAGSSERRYVFRSPEMFLRIKCDVHPWMFAYVCVMDHPYFDVSKPDGTYAIPNLPPGDYTVEAVHRKLGKISQQITITETERVTLDFTFAAPADAAQNTALIRQRELLRLD